LASVGPALEFRESDRGATVGAPTLVTVGAPTLVTIGAPTLATVGAPTLREQVGRGKTSSQPTSVPTDKREANKEATKEPRISYGADWMRPRYLLVMSTTTGQ